MHEKMYNQSFSRSVVQSFSRSVVQSFSRSVVQSFSRSVVQVNSCPLISVIVPIYKVEKYLDRCINSIVNQTYSNLEIILVDDGSPDNCPAMCDEWAKRDDRIRVIHKENGGLSSARNAGLDAAKGELIGFVDSDDFILPEMYEKLYECIIESKADISVCMYIRVNGVRNINVEWDDDYVSEVISGEEALSRFISRDGTLVYAWRKLYKAGIFRNIRFPEGRLFEDQATTHRIFGECKTAAILNLPLYVYTFNPDSITGLRDNGRLDTKMFMKYMTDYMNAWCDRYEYVSSKGKKHLLSFVEKKLYTTMKEIFRTVNYFQYRKELHEYTCYALKRLLLSKSFGNKLRGIILFMLWLRSLFRPYVYVKENDS